MFYQFKTLLCSSVEIKYMVLALDTTDLIHSIFNALILYLHWYKSFRECVSQYFNLNIGFIFFQLSFISMKKFTLNTNHMNLNLSYSKPPNSEVKSCPETLMELAWSCSLFAIPRGVLQQQKAGLLSLPPSLSWHLSATSAGSVTRSVTEVPPNEEVPCLLPDSIGLRGSFSAGSSPDRASLSSRAGACWRAWNISFA